LDGTESREIPPSGTPGSVAFFAGVPHEGHSPDECLRTGTIMVFLGIGLGLAHLVLQNVEQPGPLRWLLGVGAAVVGLYGLGNLVYYFIARNRHASSSP
jgi:hypothetical protein